MRQRDHFKQRLTTTSLAVCFFLMSVCVSWAQSSDFRVGVLTPGGRLNAVVDGLREGLDHLGYTQRKNLTFVIEDTKGEVTDLVSRAQKILETKPDVVFTVTTLPAVAAKQATTTVPVVFAWVADPIGSGLAAAYASSKNNLTGVSSYAGPLSGKRLEILKEIAPGIKRVLALVDPNDTASQIAFKFLEESATKLRVKVVRRDVTNRQEVEKVLQATARGSVEAIYFVQSIVIGAQLDLLLKKSKEDKLPLAGSEAAWVERGALLTYAADFRLIGAQAARIVAKVLKGEKPSDIPIETPEKFVLTVNLTAAKAMGLKIPRSVLERVDRVVE